MDKKHTTTEVDKHIAKEVDKHTAKEEDKNTAKEADKQTAKEEDKYTAKEADKHTAKEADKHTAKEMDCAHSGDKDEANIVAEEEEEEWLNCEKCFSTFPKEQKESHSCLPPTSPSRTSSTQASDVIDIEGDETSSSSDVIKTKPGKKSATGEKYKCTHCNGWASTTKLLKNHIQAKHRFIAREDRMECEPEGNQNASDVQVQVCNSTKLTNTRPVRCKNSNESIAAPSDSSLNDLLLRKEISKKPDQPERLEKLPKIPTRTNITLLPKKAPEERRPSKDSLLNVADGCCPLCGQAFTNITKLENHAGRCRGIPK